MVIFYESPKEKKESEVLYEYGPNWNPICEDEIGVVFCVKMWVHVLSGKIYNVILFA